ncbi:MAG: hypothetical protein FWB97_06210 [Oscillospiraceae bacterium]|nr:hypothetical protein [Oscillospiraceae bacterium]
MLRGEGHIYIADIYLPAVIRALISPFVPISRAGDVRFYSPKEIASIFQRHGFKATGTKVVGYVQIIALQKT